MTSSHDRSASGASLDIRYGKTLFPKPFGYKKLRQVRQNGQNRDTQEHSGHSEEFSADCDRENDPDRFHSRRIAHQLWSEVEPVKLLQAEYHDKKDQCFPWTDDQFDHKPGNSADKRSEIRYHVRDRHYHTDQKHIRELKDGHQQRTQYADDHRIHHFAHNISSENRITVSQNLADLRHLLPGNKRIDDQLAQPLERDFPIKHLNRYHDGDHKIEEPLYYRYRSRIENRNHFS